jgi:histidine triad (HIT) family protein
MGASDSQPHCCLFCRKHRGEHALPGGALYADALLYAGHAQIRPGHSTAYLGYPMVKPRHHIEGLTDPKAQALRLRAAPPVAA